LTTTAFSGQGEAPDARQYLRLLRRRGWILIACLIVIPVGVYMYTASRPKLFQASTILQLQGGVDLTGGSSPDLSTPTSGLQSVAALVGTNAVRGEAARRMPTGTPLGAASASSDQDTGFLTITATAPTAQRAVQTANAYSGALNATRQKRNVQRVNQAIAAAQDELGRTPKTDVGTRTQLLSQLQQLQTLRQAQSQNVQVIQAAAGAQQIAPHPKRNATVALLLAFLVGVGLMLTAERLDRKIRNPDDLESLTGLPFLGTIPHEAFPGQDANPEVDEAFQTLRNTLTYFNADQPLTTIVVTSGLKGEGKTTVASKLAAAYATFGKRVILVDTDLRKPDLAGRLHLPPSSGLSDILAGNTALDDAFVEIAPHGELLRLLPAGPIPPNASAMLGTQRMATLMSELSERADVVILDTAPLLMVSDAFPLLDKASGVLALARLDQTPRDALRRMTKILSSTGARVLGFVATDTKHSRLTGYGYGYGYGYGRREQQVAASAPQPSPAAPSGAPETDGHHANPGQTVQT
jgi:capsular exopolysaccharide synthesis family protein